MKMTTSKRPLEEAAATTPEPKKNKTEEIVMDKEECIDKFKSFVLYHKTSIVSLSYLKNCRMLADQSQTSNVIQTMYTNIINVPPKDQAEDTLQKIKIPTVCPLKIESNNNLHKVVKSVVKF
ncbi:hypothetical protein HgNV_029 [Homarus gammarus nudivirus]|uniref:Uncharacterized protein n=1 Tax=Homarus gammarus nudivirus TaxID=2509616 RepID=A0A411HB72_9VIRU|nr:hypothetical protein KM727_gp29 [Homarus gammarus nudivirus]QBB28634.1 hypothetical protein HgNV_029 [Homarus gammarus nudivirus]